MIAEFVQIVGLLSAFSSSRKSDEIADASDFLTWLSEHNHEELKERIVKNHSTTLSIKALLYEGLDKVQEKLDSISQQIAILSSRSTGVVDLAASFARVTLSDQSIEILSLMETNETEYFLLSRETGSKGQRLILAPGPNYICKDTRFFQDDLNLMLALGLLHQDYTSNDNPMYYYSRAASNLIKSMS